jgi:uncharacterized protein (DUF1499 family)
MTTFLWLLGIFLVGWIAMAHLTGGRLWLAISPFRDLGPIDFARLKPRGTPNAHLVAPVGFVPGYESDSTPPVFALAPDALMKALVDSVSVQPRVSRVDNGSDPLSARFLQRTWAMNYPDLIDVRAVSLPDGRSTLALYSRSAVGRKDFGVNALRLSKWLSRLQKELQP